MSTIAVNAITDASGGNTASINGATPTTDNTMGRNRIINGDMRIDQRNAGASTTPSTDVYLVDRWTYQSSQGSKFTWQQNRGSVTPPAGFTNYLGGVVASSVTVGATDLFLISQFIEGFNIADLGWGTANAKTVILSFQVYSSLTGTFGGVLANSAQNRSYPFTYSIPTANTWTTISVTIVGDTTGTWLTTNDVGLRVRFGLGVGSTYSGTAGAWAGSTLFSATGATSVVGTNGATFYITGVQLEAGSVATSFERRMYGQELALCQRYYQKLTYAGNGIITVGVSQSTTQAAARIDFLQEMRSAPTVTLPPAGQTAGTITFLNQASYPVATGSNSANTIDTQGFRLNGSGYTGLGGNGYASWLYITSTDVSFAVNAEL